MFMYFLRGCVNIDEYGKRYVTMGRGYTRYHIPERPKIEEHLSRVYQKRCAVCRSTKIHELLTSGSFLDNS